MIRMTKYCFFIGMLAIESASASGFNEQELQTLFTSPSERQSLNASRRSGNPTEASVTGPSSVKINGIVSRNKGRSVVWINGKNTMHNSMVDGVKVYSNSMKNNNKIPVHVDGELVYVKPGETWTQETGVVEENY